MSELQPSCERKRQRAERCPLHLNGASRPRLKRQKLDLRSREVQPAQAFWDTLSKIWLTKRALREFDRRNSQPDVSSSHLLRVGPQQISNHHALAEQKQKFGLNPNIADLRSNCRLTNFEEIKKFAKNGGPDLSDLRGVCVAMHLASELMFPFIVSRTIQFSQSQHELEPVQSRSRTRF